MDALLAVGLLASIAATLRVMDVSSQESADITILASYPASKLPGASSALFLRGSGSGLTWSTGQRMTRTADDVWSLTVPSPLAGATLEFKALIDDATWAIGANAKAVGGDEQEGTVNYYPWFRPGGGRYEVVTISSPTGPRGVACYVPPSFDENPYAMYNEALVMTDGNNVFDDSLAFGGRSWRAAPTLDSEIASGRISEVVVFAVYNSQRRITEYTYVADATYGGGGADDYLDWLENEALPTLRAQFRIAPTARLSMLGSSLGGLLACYAAWSRPQTYSASCCMSPSMWFASEDFRKNLMQTPRPSGPVPTIYLDAGDGESNVLATTTAVYNEFEQIGWPDRSVWVYVDRGAGHSEASWGDRFYLPLRVLYSGQYRT